jgi:hypothetical protein
MAYVTQDGGRLDRISALVALGAERNKHGAYFYKGHLVY